MSNLNPDDPNEPPFNPIDKPDVIRPANPDSPINVERRGYAMIIGVLSVIIVGLFVILLIFYDLNRPAPITVPVVVRPAVVTPVAPVVAPQQPTTQPVQYIPVSTQNP